MSIPRQLYAKSKYIANQLGENQDDVVDVLLGNITCPVSFVTDVMSTATQYDEDFNAHSNDHLRYQRNHTL